MNAYASYTQGSRAPTAIELGCADPANPCSLPNALSSDPPLQQVVTDTWEAGLRGKPELSFVHNLSWNAGAFRAENRNDILFVSSVQLGTGYFQNFAKTRREGFDADLDGRIGRVTWGLDYTFLVGHLPEPRDRRRLGEQHQRHRAVGISGTRRQHLHSPRQSDSADSQADREGLSRTIQATSKLVFDLNEVAVSSSYARGNENNAYKADGVYYLGPGSFTRLCDHQLPGALRSDQTSPTRGVQIDNLFNHRLLHGAQLANTGLTRPGHVPGPAFPGIHDGTRSRKLPACRASTFFTPGAPRRAWVELRLRF